MCAAAVIRLAPRRRGQRALSPPIAATSTTRVRTCRFGAKAVRRSSHPSDPHGRGTARQSTSLLLLLHLRNRAQPGAPKLRRYNVCCLSVFRERRGPRRRWSLSWNLHPLQLPGASWMLQPLAAGPAEFRVSNRLSGTGPRTPPWARDIYPTGVGWNPRGCPHRSTLCCYYYWPWLGFAKGSEVTFAEPNSLANARHLRKA